MYSELVLFTLFYYSTASTYSNEFVHNIGPSSNADTLIEETSGAESVNVGNILDPDTYLAPSPNSEPRNVGEYLEPNSAFAKQLPHVESKDTGPVLDVDGVALADDEHRPKRNVGSEKNADYPDQ